MTTNRNHTNQSNGENGKRPDWIAKSPKGYGRKERLDRVGVAWNREDGGICLRLRGTQIVTEDIYLYPADPAPDRDRR